MTNITIRPAAASDAPLVLSLLRELADYERLLDRFQVTEDDIRRDMLGNLCDCDLGFVDGVAAGVATSFWTYKSFRARRGVFVEDLYVKPAFRGLGLGTRLLAALAARARAKNGYLEWQVLDWNAPSIEFYKRLGAALSPECITCRLEGDALARLA
jgi:GNAT superfamily N-acetyltransferase